MRKFALDPRGLQLPIAVNLLAALGHPRVRAEGRAVLACQEGSSAIQYRRQAPWWKGFERRPGFISRSILCFPQVAG